MIKYLLQVSCHSVLALSIYMHQQCCALQACSHCNSLSALTFYAVEQGTPQVIKYLLLVSSHLVPCIGKAVHCMHAATASL